MRRSQLEVQAPDGRRLFAELAGPDDGALVVSHVGTPGTRHTYERHLREGAERGLRHLTYSRPGSEGSDRRPGRSFADCVPDVVAIVDELGIDTFYVVGNSGGAPHALACAALLPARVIAAAVVSGFAPRDAQGLDWLEGMGSSNVKEFEAVAAGDAELQHSIEALAENMLAAVGATDVDTTFEDCLCEADRECLVEPFIGFNLDSFKRAISGGIWGWFDDDKAAYRDWGFDLARIDVPLALWHGAEDRFVPPGHSKWLVAKLPGAGLHLLPGEGHISMYERNYGAILDELLGLPV
jgi:pimeloyl-ACP methyl ester carboxylesterase